MRGLVWSCSCLFMLSGSVPARQAQVFRAGIDLVHVGVTVSDRKGGLVTGLTADDLEVYEDGKRQTIAYFAPGDAGGQAAPPMHLAVLLDVSESMGEDMSFTKTASIKFLNRLTDGGDTRSSIAFHELVDLLKASDVTMYPIGELEHQSAFSRSQQRMQLQQMAALTGGQAFCGTDTSRDF